MPDTEATQQAYPQLGRPKPGLGFPGARLVVVLSWACGAVGAAAVGRLKGKNTREPRLVHSFHASLERDDVLLADRYDCSDWEVALLRGRGIDLVMRLPQRRTADCQRGQRWGRAAQVVSWAKPTRPAWLDEATSSEGPAIMEMRAWRVRVTQWGGRTRVGLVATTWRDAAGVTKEEWAGLYRARW